MRTIMTLIMTITMLIVKAPDDVTLPFSAPDWYMNRNMFETAHALTAPRYGNKVVMHTWEVD